MKAKQLHKPYRSLAALGKNGSTTRVLNLSAVAMASGQLPEYSERPFFKTPMLNRSLVLKHRLRADDPELLDGRGTATKVIIPIDPRNLGAGGASFLVGQNAWLDLLEEVCDADSFTYDRSVLECLDGLPSFDPFLLREHLRRKDIRPADCYFAISAADRERMRRFVSVEIGRLIDLAYTGNQHAGDRSSSKLVEILLASDVDERLEPLRLTLRLEGDAYREGIFSWKGFLYYKWALTSLLDTLRPVIVEIGKLEVKDRTNAELSAFIETSRSRIQKTIHDRCRDVSATLRTYDEAYSRLIDHGDAGAFREFLLKSPALFLELGERIGMISHIATFWRYRFPPGASLRASADDVLDLLQDFETGLARPTLYLAA